MSNIRVKFCLSPKYVFLIHSKCVVCMCVCSCSNVLCAMYTYMCLLFTASNANVYNY